MLWLLTGFIDAIISLRVVLFVILLFPALMEDEGLLSLEFEALECFGLPETRAREALLKTFIKSALDIIEFLVTLKAQTIVLNSFNGILLPSSSSALSI